VTRQERAERTRKVILDAAAAAIDERGYNAASVSEILAKAGVTKGALYFHYASKEELAQALIESQFTIELFESDETKSNGLQQVIDMSHEMAHALRTDVRVRAGMRLVAESNFANPMPEPYRKWIASMLTHLQVAEKRGDLRENLDPEKVATWVIGSYLGIQSMSEVLTGRADLHERLTDFWVISLPGLVPPRRISRFLPAGSVSLNGAVTA
jgi:AcrR family transcriptional regulator